MRDRTLEGHWWLPGREDNKVPGILTYDGTEPSLRWRTFTSLVSGLATDLEVSLVVTLGSLLADVPHTRPAPVTAMRACPGPGTGAALADG